MINKWEMEQEGFSVVLTMTSAGSNNNKEYRIERIADDTYRISFGRIGGASNTQIYSLSKAYSKLREKMNKGYTVKETVDVQAADAISDDVIRTSLADKVIEQVAFPVKRGFQTKAARAGVETLLRDLVAFNRHHIAEISGGQITVGDDGLVKTPVGILSAEAVAQGRRYLDSVKRRWQNWQDGTGNEQGYIEALNDYLMTIPQKVGNRRGWHKSFFKDDKDFVRQSEFLDGLENSVNLYNATKAQAVKSDIKVEVHIPRRLKLLTDKVRLQEIHDFYRQGINQRHASSDLKLLEVWEILYENDKGNPVSCNNPEFERLAAEKGNVQQMWHGSRNFNILSILKGGLIIPKSDHMSYSGRMFGDGVYSSEQATKALNYSMGYWGRGGYDDTCFMFLADFVLGKVFDADDPQLQQRYDKRGFSYPVKGYDSTHGAGGTGNLTEGGGIYNLSNSEWIVYDLNQVNLRYLCKFGK